MFWDVLVVLTTFGFVFLVPSLIIFDMHSRLCSFYFSESSQNSDWSISPQRWLDFVLCCFLVPPMPHCSRHVFFWAASLFISLLDLNSQGVLGFLLCLFFRVSLFDYFKVDLNSHLIARHFPGKFNRRFKSHNGPLPFEPVEGYCARKLEGRQFD